MTCNKRSLAIVSALFAVFRHRVRNSMRGADLPRTFAAAQT